MPQTMITRVQVKYGRLAEFLEAMQKTVLPLVERSGSQRLIASYQTQVGADFHEVLNIWEFDDVRATIGEAENPIAAEEMGALFDAIKDLIDREGASLVVKTPYSP